MDKYERSAERILMKCGCYPALAGFETLRTAIGLIAREPTAVHNLRKRVHPYVAEKLGMTPNAAQTYSYRGFYTILDHVDLRTIASELRYYPANGEEYTMKEFLVAVAIAVRREVDG